MLTESWNEVITHIGISNIGGVSNDGNKFHSPSLNKFIDTLFLSPLLYPEQPYHRLVKDDKLDPENLNNPYIDATKARDLFYDEMNEFKGLDKRLKSIY